MAAPENLLIDIGNTFVKWGRYRAGAAGSAADNCLDSGHPLLAEVPELYRSEESNVVLYRQEPIPLDQFIVPSTGSPPGSPRTTYAGSSLRIDPSP
mgnify:CR=1 FL=1